jgi:hypothetical protein
LENFIRQPSDARHRATSGPQVAREANFADGRQPKGAAAHQGWVIIPRHPASEHLSGIGLVVVLEHFERAMKPVDPALRGDRGVNRHAVAFSMLVDELME